MRSSNDQTPSLPPLPVEAEEFDALPADIAIAPRRAPSKVLNALRQVNAWRRSFIERFTLPEDRHEGDLLGYIATETPPWFVSLIVHFSLMILLGLAALGVSDAVEKDKPIEIELAPAAPVQSEIFADTIGDQLDDPTQTFSSDGPEVGKDIVALAPDDLPLVNDPLVGPPVLDVLPLGTVIGGTEHAPAIGLEFSGREHGMKEALLKSYGGTKKTENAVALGLRWLVAQQHRAGMWSLTGPYVDGSGTENPEAATAMALLALQGAGYTPASDPKQPFTKAVSRGWTALLKRQKSDGRFFDRPTGTQDLYTHAQCTIAVCELYAMTREAVYFDAAQRAVDYCVKIQSPQGGWRYVPGEDSDMSVTGWFVMALQSARMAGIEVPSPVFEKIESFLDSVSRGDEHGYDIGSRYAYRPRDGATLPLTAEGLLCRQYLGWRHDDSRLTAGAEYLSANLPAWDKRNVYYWYYATQALHHMEGDLWRKWNDEMKVLLPKHQEKRGRERGSWDPKGDRWGDAGGRLYVTCLSLCTLEVYYRHLPIYKKGVLAGE